MESPPSHDEHAEPVNPGKGVAVQVRVGEPGDIAFITDSWLRSYACDQWTSCPGGPREYFDTQRQVVAACLQSSEVLVACPEDGLDQILGWLCWRPHVLHYVYVKPYYRRRGVGMLLLERAFAGIERLHVTHGAKRPHGERGAGCRALVAKADAMRVEIEVNPALIFGRKT